GVALARRQIAVPDLIGARNALCASVGGVVVLVRGKWKTTGQGVDTADMPSAEHSIHDLVIQMRMTAAKRYLVVKTQYPAEFLIEVCQCTLRREIIAVLRERRSAADFRQIIDGFAIGERA